MNGRENGNYYKGVYRDYYDDPLLPKTYNLNPKPIMGLL